MNAKSIPRIAGHSHPSASSELALVDGRRSVVNQLRRVWFRKLLWRFALFVGLPTAAAGIYFGFVASDQFESVALLELQVPEPGAGSRVDSLFGGGPNSNASTRELLAMREFVLSRAVFDSLANSNNILAHFQARRWDAISKLSARANREQAYSYYLKKVAADYDAASGTLSLRVRAFEPRVAQAFAAAIISSIEYKLDASAEVTRAIALRDAESQLDRAKNRIVAIRRDAGQLGGDASDRLKYEIEFAEKAYEASAVALAELRAQEARRRAVLITLAKPSLADVATYPRRIAAIGTVFVFCALGLGIVSLTVSAIREHAQI